MKTQLQQALQNHSMTLTRTINTLRAELFDIKFQSLFSMVGDKVKLAHGSKTYLGKLAYHSASGKFRVARKNFDVGQVNTFMFADGHTYHMPVIWLTPGKP